MRIYKIAAASEQEIQKTMSYLMYTNGQYGYLGEMIADAFQKGDSTKLNQAADNIQKLINAYGNQKISMVVGNIQTLMNAFGDLDMNTIQEKIQDIQSAAQIFSSMDPKEKELRIQTMMGGKKA